MILGESDSSSIKRLPPLKSTERTGPRPRYLILALKYEKIKKNTIYLQIKAASSHWNRNRKQISMCLKAQCLCNFTLLSFWNIEFLNCRRVDLICCRSTFKLYMIGNDLLGRYIKYDNYFWDKRGREKGVSGPVFNFWMLFSPFRLV